MRDNWEQRCISRERGDECVTFADGARLVFWVWSHHHQRQQKAIEEDTIVTEIRVYTVEKRSGDGVGGGGKTIWMLMARSHQSQKRGGKYITKCIKGHLLYLD
jgi:hypothetical protein